MRNKYLVKVSHRGKRQNLIGQKSAKLTVVEKLQNDRYGRSIWRCLCDCGNYTTILSNSFNTGKKQSCGCLQQKTGEQSHSWKGCGKLPGAMWHWIKQTAKRRDIEFDLDIKDAWNLYEKQNGKCAISGIPIEFAISQNRNERYKGTASLDRIDSNIAYILGNVQWVHKDVNFMKQQFKQDYFISMCKTITENQNEN